jgi:hypothetical protein
VRRRARDDVRAGRDTAGLEREQEGQHLGDGGVEVGRDLVADVAGLVQRPGSGTSRTSGTGAPAPARGSWRRWPRCPWPPRAGAPARLVAQRHGDVRRVDQHDVGGGDVGHHPVAAHPHLPLADHALHLRVAVGLLVLVLDVLDAHPLVLGEVPSLVGEVRGRQDQAEQGGAAQEGQGGVGGAAHHRRQAQPADVEHVGTKPDSAR